MLRSNVSQVDEFIGARLRLKRLDQSFTSEQFSDEVGCSPSELDALETGLMRLTPALMMRCCTILNVKPSYFFAGISDINPSVDGPPNSNIIDLVARRRRRQIG
jgi:transcriptional regulator with XRE-family HTH domain